MLMMNVVSLVFAVTMNSICIPLFGIAGAALSCMSYQILQCTWMNLYLRKMGFWPYRMSLLVQVVWIVAIIVREPQTYSKEAETTTHADALQKNILRIWQRQTRHMA